MSRRTAAALVCTLLAATGCAGQTAPIYSPPPGGHDTLSKPPAALLTGQGS